MSTQDFSLWEYLNNALVGYKEKPEISKFWEGISRLAADLRLSMYQADSAKCIRSVSDEWNEDWFEVEVKDTTYMPGESLPGYVFAFSMTDDPISLPSLVDYPDNERITYREFTDYIYKDSVIYFKSDPRSVEILPVDNDGELSHQIKRKDLRLYCKRAKHKRDLVYKNFGVNIGYPNTGNQYYDKEVQSLYSSITSGPSKRSLLLMLNVLLGYNLGYMFSFEPEIIRKIDRERLYTSIISDNKRYRIPYFSDPSVSIYDSESIDWDTVNVDDDLRGIGIASQYDVLGQFVKIYDYSSAPEYFDKRNFPRYPLSRLLVFLSSIMVGGDEVGTFSDNGHWDDGEYMLDPGMMYIDGDDLIHPTIYTTNLDDVVPPTPYTVDETFDMGGFFDDDGGLDETRKWSDIDSNLADEVFENSKHSIAVAEFDRRSVTKTTFNYRDEMDILSHVNCFYRSPIKSLFFRSVNSELRDRDVSSKSPYYFCPTCGYLSLSKISKCPEEGCEGNIVEYYVGLHFPVNVCESCNYTTEYPIDTCPECGASLRCSVTYQNTYIDIEIEDGDDPEEYLQVEVPDYSPKNQDFDPVDLEGVVRPILDGNKNIGSKIIMVTENPIKDTLSKRIKGLSEIYLGSSIPIEGRLDSGETFDDWDYPYSLKNETPPTGGWNWDPDEIENPTRFDDIISQYGWEKIRTCR